MLSYIFTIYLGHERAMHLRWSYIALAVLLFELGAT